jgi:hypothetical protein
VEQAAAQFPLFPICTLLDKPNINAGGVDGEGDSEVDSSAAQEQWLGRQIVANEEAVILLGIDPRGRGTIHGCTITHVR